MLDKGYERGVTRVNQERYGFKMPAKPAKAKIVLAQLVNDVLINEELSPDFNERKKTFYRKLLNQLKNSYTMQTEQEDADCYEAEFEKQINKLLVGEYSLKADLPPTFKGHQQEKLDKVLSPEYDSFKLLENKLFVGKDSHSTRYKIEEIVWYSIRIKDQFESEMKTVLNGLYEGALMLSLKARFSLDKEFTEKEIWTNPSFQRIVVKYTGETYVAVAGDRFSHGGSYSLVEKQAILTMQAMQKVSNKKFQVKDLLRGTAYVPSYEKMLQITDVLDKAYGIQEIKNRLYDESAPYYSIFIIFNFYGILAELQIIPVEDNASQTFYQNKQIAHALYELVRNPGLIKYSLNQRVELCDFNNTNDGVYNEDDFDQRQDDDQDYGQDDK